MNLIEHFARDVRFGLRMLRRSPRFTFSRFSISRSASPPTRQCSAGSKAFFSVLIRSSRTRSASSHLPGMIGKEKRRTKRALRATRTDPIRVPRGE